MPTWLSDLRFGPRAHLPSRSASSEAFHQGTTPRQRSHLSSLSHNSDVQFSKVNYKCPRQDQASSYLGTLPEQP